MFLAQTDVIILFFGSKQPPRIPEYLNLDARKNAHQNKKSQKNTDFLDPHPVDHHFQGAEI